MKNNYEFWYEYNKDTLKRIKELSEEKDEIYADFHMHSDYSADSDQSLEQIIKRSKELKIDIIAITDHDSIKVYDELYEYLKTNTLTTPIIVPGVEFTIDNSDYGSQFHILQLMINPKSKSIIENIKHQERAGWIRTSKQLDRLKKNNGIQYFLKKYNIKYNIYGYKKYLSSCFRPIPEYKTIMEYIMSELKPYKITNWILLEELEKWNKEDKCTERKKIKEEAYKKLKEKYKDDPSSDYNHRFFHCLLAIRGADDDFFPEYDCMGDLSVNNFNELKLEQLNKDNITFFAHPSENKLYLLKKLLSLNTNICGMEFNKRCKYSDSKYFYDELKKLNMLKIVGSDSHNIDSDLYDDMSFYKLTKEDIINFINKAKTYYTNKNK